MGVPPTLENLSPELQAWLADNELSISKREKVLESLYYFSWVIQSTLHLENGDSLEEVLPVNKENAFLLRQATSGYKYITQPRDPWTGSIDQSKLNDFLQSQGKDMNWVDNMMMHFVSRL
jgi:hypothetical protein